MRIFVTGASGWVGRALVPELVAAGHRVVGLARSDAAAGIVGASGARPVRGDLDDLDVLRRAADAADGVVHLAFRHDIAFSGDFAGAVRSDRAVIEAVGGVLAGSGRPFVIASGILGVLGVRAGETATETDGIAPGARGEGGPISGSTGRIGNAHRVLALADRGIRPIVVRLPPATHGAGDNGFVATAVRFARKTGSAAYIGDGSNRWPAVHRDDAAHLFLLALEKAPGGSVLHAVAEQGVPMREVARAIGRGLGVPVASVRAEEAAGHVGWLSGFWGLDGPAASDRTRELVGWNPSHPGLLADLEAGHYFG